MTGHLNSEYVNCINNKKYITGNKTTPSTGKPS